MVILGGPPWSYNEDHNGQARRICLEYGTWSYKEGMLREGLHYRQGARACLFKASRGKGE